MKRPIEKELNRLEPDKAVINELERSVDRLDEVINKLDDVSSRVSAIEIPSEVSVSNFPEPEPYPEFPDFPDFPTEMKVEVTNFPAQVFPKVQKVEVLNQVEIPETKIEFPEVQKVEVLNFPAQEKIEFPAQKEVIFPEVQKSVLVDSDGREIDFEKISEKLGKSLASAPQFVGAGGGISTGVAKESTLQTLQDPLLKYKVSDLDEGATSYYGFLDLTGGWYIMELTSTTARYIKGTSGYSTAWSNRIGLNYGYYNAIFNV